LVGKANIISSDSNYTEGLDNLIVLSIEQFYEGIPYIYTYDLKTGQLQKVTNQSGYNPVWTKDKQKIVFSADREYDPSIIDSPSSNSDIYIINIDGTNEIKITDNKVSYRPGTNKVNNLIFYVTELPEDDFDKVAIIAVDLNNDNSKTIVLESEYYLTFDVSPDSQEIVFDTDYGVYWYNINKSSIKKLIEAEGFYYYASPMWSPDGEEILYLMGKGTFTKMSIYIMDKNGQNNREIASNIAFYDAAWSPDGERIIFMTHENGRNRLYIINKDGTGLEEVKLPLDKPYKIYGVDW